jgi:hypothetical protein
MLWGNDAKSVKKMGGTEPRAEYREEVSIVVEQSDTEDRIMSFMGKYVSSFLWLAG